ncbi:MAG: helix-turn-helix transcriptional regulator [Sphingomonadales bacterium]|nr:helix-turn-helix transcriptional regulator [Sphingomonadales bacterium]
MSIGGRFLEVRKARGLKQTDVAEAIGISHGAVVNYEKGRDPPADAIIAFSKAFNVNPMWLLMGIGRADQSSTDDIYGRSIEIAWTYLARGGDEVEKGDLIKLGSALFQYLMEHGEISEAMTEKLLSLSA